MAEHPDFAVGDIVYLIRTLSPWDHGPVEVTGYDPVAGVVFWRDDDGTHGFGPARLFSRERPDG